MKLVEWLVSKNVPENVINIFDKTHNFPYGKEIGSVNFFTTPEIIELNTEEDWLPQFIKTRLLAIGSCINGDFWVLDYRNGNIAVAVTAHDDSADDIADPIPDRLICPIADSFEKFLSLAKEDKLPIDYYEARDREELKF